jgi:hypothetical protein
VRTWPWKANSATEFAPKKQKKSKNGDQKIRVAEIHLSKITKLDRAEKRDCDAPVPELGPETEGPFCHRSGLCQ